MKIGFRRKLAIIADLAWLKLSYKNNTVINPTKPACVIVTGIGNYTGAGVPVNYVIKKADITKVAKIVLDDKELSVSSKGGDYKSLPKVFEGDKALSIGVGKDIEAIKSSDYKYYYADYDIVSVSNNKFLGQATVTLAGKGMYGGTKTVKIAVNAKDLR